MVERIFRLWEALQPGWEVVAHDDASCTAVLAAQDIDDQRLFPTLQSDTPRLSALAEGGGVWMDASLLPVVPLEIGLGPVTGSAGAQAEPAASAPGGGRCGIRAQDLHSAMPCGFCKADCGGLPLTSGAGMV